MAAIARAMRKNSLPAVGLDMENDQRTQNLMHGLGFINHLTHNMRLKDFESLDHYATLCSSWVWINRASSLRSDAQPMGDTERAPVVLNLAMAFRIRGALRSSLMSNCGWQYIVMYCNLLSPQLPIEFLK